MQQQSQWMAVAPVALYGLWAKHPLKVPLPIGDLAPSKTWFLGPTQINTPKRHLDWLIHFGKTHCFTKTRKILRVTMLLNGMDNPQNCPFLYRDLDLNQYMVPWVHSSLHFNRHLNWFDCVCRAHERDQETDRHTDRPCYFICSNRLHLAIDAMQIKRLVLMQSIKQINHHIPLWSSHCHFQPRNGKLQKHQADWQSHTVHTTAVTGTSSAQNGTIQQTENTVQKH